MKILIVDDSDLIRQRLTRFLTTLPEAPEIFEASSQDDAIKLLDADPPSLVILDISLPVGSGIQVLEYIRSKNIPARVIVFTNFPFPQIEKRCLELGAENFLSKSTGYERITEIIQEMVKTPEIKLTNKQQVIMKKILVVDDSPTMRRMIISSLREIPQVQFEQAESGLGAIEKLALFKFDIVLLDLNMPDMHGMEVLQFIRRHQVYKDIPVVILTTKSDEKSMQEAIVAGANLFTTKPFVPAVFTDNIKALLNH